MPQNRNGGHAKALDPLQSPVTAQELADWLALDSADPLLNPMLLTATDAIIRRLGYDLLARDWKYTLWDWPVIGTPTSPSLSRQASDLDRVIELPYAKIISLDSVTSYGAAVTGTVARQDDVALPRGVERYAYQINDDPALVFAYRAGFGEAADDVPDSIKTAIKQIAGFLYEHRGACDAAGAMHKSGAAAMLTPWMRPNNVVVW